MRAEWCPAHQRRWERVSRFRLDTTEPKSQARILMHEGIRSNRFIRRPERHFSLIDTERLVLISMKGRPLVWKTSLLHCYAKVGDADGYGRSTISRIMLLTLLGFFVSFFKSFAAGGCNQRTTAI